MLAIRFQPFDLKKMLDREPPLEVALVNAKSTTKPTKADILAQANLDGGGNTDADRRAKTPLPVAAEGQPEHRIDGRHAEGRGAGAADEGADDAVFGARRWRPPMQKPTDAQRTRRTCRPPPS